MVKSKNYGRFGNVAFQIAVAIAYSKKHGLDYTVQDKTNNPKWNPLYFQRLVNPKWNNNLPSVNIVEKQFHYYELPFDESWRDKNIILDGYWQSYKHIDDYRDDIIEAFALPYELNANICSIHCRYGDYLTISGKHVIVDEPYLLAAMEHITAETGIIKFKVFSDDLPLFKNRHGHLYDFEYSTNKSEIEDITEISCCHSNINSSSTFSWWAAWLNQNPDKIIITQSKWFQDGWKENGRERDPSDILPSNWIRL